MTKVAGNNADSQGDAADQHGNASLENTPHQMDNENMRWNTYEVASSAGVNTDEAVPNARVSGA